MTNFSKPFVFTLLTLFASASFGQNAGADEQADALFARLTRAKAELDATKADLDAQLARVAAAGAARPARETSPAPAQPQTADAAGVVGPNTPVVQVVGRKTTYDPMRLKVVMRFPANVKTIQQATQYMLETVNYKLTLSPLNTEESRQILSRPLLPQDGDGSLKSIEDGLLQISGEDTVLIIDRANKLISFELQKKK